MPRDRERLARLQSGMSNAGLDAMVCRLPENVLLLSGYWPMNGMSWVVLGRDQEPVVIAPVGEEEWVEAGWNNSALFYGWGGVDDDPPDVSVARLLEQTIRRLGLYGKGIGYEGSFETIAPPYASGEHHVSALPANNMLARLFGGSLVDITPLIDGWRAVKTDTEIAALRTANEVAALGLAAFVEAAVPGAKEAEVSAAVEAAICTKGTGYRGVRRCRSWASVMSGPDQGAKAWYQFLISSDRRLQEGDTVLLELGTVVEGYWSDLTRTVIAGKAGERVREGYNLVLQAQQAAIDTLRDGVPAAQVYAATRDVIEVAGWRDMYPHGAGHGVGFRYHEALPALLPGNQELLQAGMVVTVEPGVYGLGFGGIRIEDNLLVTVDGCEFLSKFPRELLETGA